MNDDIAVCPRDGEPMVWTFEFPKYEFFCVTCGYKAGAFGPTRRRATPELQRRLDELTAQYERERAERDPSYRPPESHPKVGDPGVTPPTCTSCGRTPDDGIALVNGKPRSWFSRTQLGVTEYACSRACIPEGAMVMPW